MQFLVYRGLDIDTFLFGSHRHTHWKTTNAKANVTNFGNGHLSRLPQTCYSKVIWHDDFYILGSRMIWNSQSPFFLLSQVAGGLFGGGGGREEAGWLPASLLICALNKQKRQLHKLLFIANTGNARRKDIKRLSHTKGTTKHGQFLLTFLTELDLKKGPRIPQVTILFPYWLSKSRECH